MGTSCDRMYAFVCTGVCCMGESHVQVTYHTIKKKKSENLGCAWRYLARLLNDSFYIFFTVVQYFCVFHKKHSVLKNINQFIGLNV